MPTILIRSATLVRGKIFPTRRYWRCSMTPTPEHRDPDFHREHDPSRFQVVYLVKRPSYEFVYYSPTAPAAYLSGEQAFVQMRFQDRHRGQAHVLELEVLEDLY